MQTMTRSPMVLGSCIALVVAVFVGCGGGGGGGNGAGATVTGNVSSAATAANETANNTWLARLGEDLLGFARRVHAAMEDTSVNGIMVTVAHGKNQMVGMTDAMGDFRVGDVPTGSVIVSFSRGACNAPVPIDDMIDGSTLQLVNVTIRCNSATPAAVVETFQGVLENIPASQNGNLNVCAFGGASNHVRAVKTDTNTSFENSNGGAASFSDFAEGDLVEATGQRKGIGTFTALTATTLRRIGSGNTDPCKSIPTPTPASSSTPTATPTP